MKAFLIFLGLAVACGADLEPNLKVKFGVGGDAFMPMPITKAEAIAQGYKLTPGPKIALTGLVLYCPSEKDDKTDKALCIYVDDKTGHICGLNIAIRVKKVSKYRFNWSVQGWTEWPVQTEDGNIVLYLTKQQFYCSSEFLQKPVEERIASRKKNKVLPEEAILLSGYNNTLMRLSTSEAALKRSGFTKQGFFVGMGQHYYHKMTPETECNAESMFCWFGLTQKRKMIGVGLMMFAEIDNDFFENPGEAAVKMIVPHGPTCLPKMAVNGGVRTMHFYFIDKPRFLLWPL